MILIMNYFENGVNAPSRERKSEISLMLSSLSSKGGAFLATTNAEGVPLGTPSARRVVVVRRPLEDSVQVDKDGNVMHDFAINILRKRIF